MALIECPECGKVVSQTAEACPNCGYAVKKHFDEIAAAEAAEKRRAESAAKRQQRNKVLKIVIPIVLIIGAIVTGFVINHIILSERMLFESEDEMYRYLTSAKCWELDNDYREEYFVFYPNDRYVRLSEREYYNQGGKIKLNPQRGYFEILSITGSVDKKYIISKTGDIVSDNKEDYYKIRFTTPSTSLESGYYVLDIEVLSAEVDEKGNFKSEYKITNNGKNSYRHITLETIVTYDDGEKETLSDFEIVESNSNTYVLRPGDVGTAHATLINPSKKIVNATGYVSEYMIDYKY